MLPKLPKLFSGNGTATVPGLASRVQEWASSAQDLLRALRQFVEETDFQLAHSLKTRSGVVRIDQSQPPTEGQVLTATGPNTAEWRDP